MSKTSGNTRVSKKLTKEMVSVEYLQRAQTVGQWNCQDADLPTVTSGSTNLARIKWQVTMVMVESIFVYDLMLARIQWSIRNRDEKPFQEENLSHNIVSCLMMSSYSSIAIIHSLWVTPA